ncbi:hypothetical protein [Mesorhizobium sp.]|uniref:hypothetical protein n=1 Tax=Mesorhizobium sp. TaxID=1871066 RepID=UPI0025EC34C0|nr:hypothetical protein [Mesorhizobium sp.]
MLGLPVDLLPLPEAPDELIELTSSTPKPRRKRARKEGSVRQSKPAKKPQRPARHPLLFGLEEHMRKTRDVKEGEFLRPYKRILPDLISSGTQLLRALSIANDLYLALDEKGYRVQIAPAAGDLDRIRINEQEVESKDGKYGQYHSGSIWAPDRPTVLYVDTVPIGLAITEMTERVTVRYFNGEYHREDSRLIRSAKPWQLTHSWTREQDVPCGRFRVIAYSPKKGVDWSVTWQETEHNALGALIPKIAETLKAAKGTLQRLMDAEDVAAAKRKKEREEEWERYLKQEDARKVAQALADSQQQLADIIARWGKAMTVERFFLDAEERLNTTDDKDRRKRLEERLALARAMMESVDPLDFIESWLAPQERYQAKFV